MTAEHVAEDERRPGDLMREGLPELRKTQEWIAMELRRRRVPILLCVVLLVGACTGKGRDTLDGTSVRAVSEPLPTLSGTSIDGRQLSSKDFFGRILVVNVWAHWCTPCELEQPDLVEVASRYIARGVRFLGIDHMDQDAAARAWVDSYHVPYPSIADPTGSFAAVLDYVGLPDTYVVDRTGTLRYIVGPGATNVAQLSGLLDALLAGGGTASG